MAILSKPKPAPTPDLEQKIHTLRSELDSEIDRRAETLRASMPGVPFQVIRNIITRSSPCQCASYLLIQESDI
jgi:hypothetical protein